MQPGYPPPGEDPYGQQQPYQDPYSQPQYGQQQPPQYGQQPQYGDPNAQPPAYQDPYAAPGAPTSGSPYPTSPPGYPSSPAGYPAGYPAQPAYGTPGYGAPPAQNNTLGLIGLILGILAIPFGLCYPLLGILLGIGGGVLGGLGLKKVSEGQASNRGMALAGLICGGVGIVIGIVVWIASATIDLTNL